MGEVVRLRCRWCGTAYAPERRAVCDDCFGPLDCEYEPASLHTFTPEAIATRSRTLWRYWELLPVRSEPGLIDLHAGFTPLIRAERLARQLGLRQLWVKNDTVNPTGSFKDRPAAVAVSWAREHEDSAVACASTGNLAAAVAAHAAVAGIPCYVLVPAGTETTKLAQVGAYGARILLVDGTYDDVNRLAIEAAEVFRWNVVNVTGRPYYTEGSKTLGFEICEQLGWRAPEHIIIPVASGALLEAVARGLRQLHGLGLVDDRVKLHGAQASGCAPVAQAFRSGREGVVPVTEPQTIAKSIAIGDPADGISVLRTVRQRGGSVASVSDEEIVEAVRLLAKTEGVFTEPAGAVTIAVLTRLARAGIIASDESVVCCVTGNGLKTPEVVATPETLPSVPPRLEALAEHLGLAVVPAIA